MDIRLKTNAILSFRTSILALSFLIASVAWAHSAFASAVLVEQLKFDTNPAPEVRAVELTATLYIPHITKPVAAMVIINSSGGVLDTIEGHYARSLTQNGIAALVVDSFKPRKISNINEDQSLVSSWEMENDAFAALAVLKRDPRIDSNRIGIMGVSKGGMIAMNSALKVRRGHRRTGSLAFALHVAIVPFCNTSFRDTTTTGQPIFYMLAELDDLTPSKPCVGYADRLRKAGNKNVSVKVYPGQHHAWELIGPVIHMKTAENYSACASIIEDNGDHTVTATNKVVPLHKVGQWMKSCAVRGSHVGGGTAKQKRQATADLISFLKQNGF
jgi:dienelactone hydrolase